MASAGRKRAPHFSEPDHVRESFNDPKALGTTGKCVVAILFELPEGEFTE